MADSKFDAIVLGGGPGGYVCAIRLAQLGLKTACVETETVGGVCLNWGCIPSKALITNAHHYTKSQHLAAQGISFGDVSVDVGAMQSWKDGIVNKLTSGIRGLFKTNGVTLIEGTGVLTGARQIEVTLRDGSRTQLTAERAIVVATGSATIEVPGFEFDGSQIIGAREAVSLKQVPKRMLVIGGGVIGLELGMTYQAFGAELTVVELTNSLLPGVEPDAVRLIERRITSRGGKILKGTRAEGYSKRPDGTIEVKTVMGSEVGAVECDVVLVAVGMRP
ncbi:MAG TPA: FAD-dependent oxidoreductase, partial [Polyangiaceae bacterium]